MDLLTTFCNDMRAHRPHLSGGLVARLCLTAVLLFAACGVRGAQSGLWNRPGEPYFKTVTTADGLPANTINTMAIDRFGFLWLGTTNGVGRYDGTRTEIVRTDVGEEPTVEKKMIRVLLGDDEGMWVGSDGGLDFVRFSDERVFPAMVASGGRESQVKKRVFSMIECGGWLTAVLEDATMVHAKVDDARRAVAAGKSPVFSPSECMASRVYVKLCRISDDRFLAFSTDGFTVFSPGGSRELGHTPFPSTIDGNMNVAYVKENSVVYAGWGIGRKGRAFRFDGASNTLAEDDKIFVPSGLMQTVVTDGSTVFATDGGGLYICSPAGEVRNFRQENSSLPGNAIYCCLAGDNGELWIGTYRRGLSVYSPRLSNYGVANVANNSVSHDIVTGIVACGGGVALGLDGGGLELFSRFPGPSHTYNESNSSLASDNVTSLVARGDEIWMTLYSCGLSRFDRKKGTFSLYVVPKEIEPAGKVWTLLDGNDGTLWVGGNSLSVFDPVTEKFTVVEGTSRMLVMSMSRQGRFLWIATRKSGVMKIDCHRREVVAVYSTHPTANACVLPSDNIEFIFGDSKGNVWFNVTGIGLYALTPDGKLANYGPADGLDNPGICSAVEDTFGRLWFGTYNGLFCYNPSNSVFTRIEDPRLPMEFTAGAATCIGNDIYMGTTDGLLIFDPSLTEPSEAADVELCFSSVTPLGGDGEKIVLTGMESPEVVLPYDGNYFSVRFSVPRMAAAGKIRYSWRLDGYESKWRPATELSEAIYTNVSPGNYTFEVRHSLPDGSWSEPSRMAIEVMPPWYLSVWAKMIWVVIALLVIGGALYLWYVSLVSRQKARIARIEKESERRLNETKLNFYAKVTHELRTPVFLIAAQIEELMGFGKEVVPVRMSYLKGLYRNSRKLNRLISNILDYRKLDLGRIEMAVRKRDVRLFLQSLVTDFENLCRQKDIDFTFKAPAAPLAVPFDEDKMEIIVTNLVSNAFKYTKEGGSIVLSLTDNGPVYEIAVSDSGIGIVKDMQQEIFKPFFRTERGKGQGNGDGIGLAYVKELVELHNGTIKVDSQEGKGSTFTVTVPKDLPESSEQPVAGDFPPVADAEPSAVQGRKVEHPHIQNPTATRSILIIDDEPEVADFVGRVFAEDYRIFRARSGEQGVEIAQKEHPDVVVTDMMMSGMDGSEVVRTLRSDPSMSTTRIVVFTAVTSEEEMIRVLDEGADAYFTKPMSLKLLRKQIEKLLGGRVEPSLPAPGLAVAAKSFDLSGQQSTAYNKEEQQFLLRCRNVIEENLLNEEFSIEFLASKLAMSHSALYKKIRRLTGLSLIDFINENRICKAVLLFREGNTNVQKVGEMCGFRDVKTFRETFKKKIGMPPKQFIQSL